MRDHSAVPVAAGERFYGLHAWNDVLRRNAGTLTDIRPKGDTFYFFDGLDRDTPVC